MIESVAVPPETNLDEYAAYTHLISAVADLRAEAATAMPKLRGRKLWMVNSAAVGGGVAEMLPRMVLLLRELGLQTEWVVMGTNRMEFFDLTKRLHNAIHGAGSGEFGAEDLGLYQTVSEENFADWRPRIGEDDIVLIHDPQPAGLGALVKQRLGNLCIWQCHIGLDETNAATEGAWKFLRPYTESYDHAVFSAPEYIPDFLAGRSTIIHPAIDPTTHKNREISPRSLVGILCNAALTYPHQPVLNPPFPEPVLRLRSDGAFTAAILDEEIGLMYLPMVVQVSRWDRLKGFKPLMDAFIKMKRRVPATNGTNALHARRLSLCRLILAGPDPASIVDDPEGRDVLDELTSFYQTLDPHMQRQIALISLPMASRDRNALIVNALQRCASVVVQNSVREGFGLTCTEAMWKRSAVLATQACGLRQQIRDGIDGRLVDDALDVDNVAETLDEVLRKSKQRHLWGRNAQRRVHAEFLIFAQLAKWLRLLANCATAARRRYTSSRGV